MSTLFKKFANCAVIIILSIYKNLFLFKFFMRKHLNLKKITANN